MTKLRSRNIEFNDKEGYARISVDPKIYSLETIYAAGYVFLDRLYVLLDEGKGKKIDIYLYPQSASLDLKKSALEFYNELLNYAHYFTRAKNNAEAIKLILQRALFSVTPQIREEVEEREISELLKELEKEDKQKRANERSKASVAVGKKKR